MKGRIIRTLADIFFIMIVFAITDWLMMNVFHTEKLLPELLVYIAVYGGLSWVRLLVCRAWRMK